MGLLGGIARTAIAAGTWTVVSNEVSRRQAGRWAAQDQSHPPAYMPPPPGRYQRPMFQQPLHQHAHQAPVYVQPPPAAAPPADDMTTRLAQLKQLGELKAQGVLTPAEFEAQKSKILGT